MNERGTGRERERGFEQPERDWIGRSGDSSAMNIPLRSVTSGSEASETINR